MLFVGEYYRQLTRETQKTLAGANSVAEEMLTSMSTVRGFGAESIEKSVYDEHLLDFKAVNVRQALAYTGVVLPKRAELPLLVPCGTFSRLTTLTKRTRCTVLRAQVIVQYLPLCPTLSRRWSSTTVASWCSCSPRS